MEIAVSNVSDNKDVEVFSNGCALSRSIYRFMLRLFKDSSPTERDSMLAVAPLFFPNLTQVFQEYVVIAACRITDPAKDPQGNKNFTVEMFVNNFAPETEAFKQLNALHQKMKPFREKIKVARRKLAAHSDVAAVRGPPLDAGSWAEWDQFWTTLKDFVRILNEQTIRKSFDIDAADVSSEGNKLLTALGGPERVTTPQTAT
jgi:hypothetical protein